MHLVRTLGQLVASLSPDDNLRGRQFEPVAKWFLENDPVQKVQFRRVWRWKDWPGGWAADAGIDLVAERRDRSLVAVQVKCYRADRFVSKRDMDTFLSESSRKEFTERLLIATCDVGRTARRTIEGQEKPVHTLLLSDLEHSPVTWPSDPGRLKAFTPKPRKHRPHQRRAIMDVLAGFETSERGQLIMACGTGKTLTALWIAEGLAPQRTLVLLPSLSLLAQTVREWKTSDARDFEFLAVCSDQTAVDEDANIAHTADLPFTGVTTDPERIAAFLRQRGPRVVFATYQSSPRIAEAQALGRVPLFDLAVADEAHRCAGKVDATFGSILDETRIKARRRLFMTATPRIATGPLKRAAVEADLEIVSMDDAAIFGPVFHRLSFGQAIEQDLLSDYQVVVMIIDDETIRGHAERGAFVELDDGKVRDARTLAAQIGLAKAMRRYGLRRTLSFHSRVTSAARFATTLPEVVAWMPPSERPGGELWTAHVSGEMPSGQRDRLLRRLAATTVRQRAVLSNARCLTEGVDVPTLDGVAFIDPRRSQVDVVQAVGRAIRKSVDKSVGTIVLPVFLPGGGVDAAETLNASMFEPIVQVLRAMRDHDEQLGEALDALRRELGRRGSIRRLPDKIRIDAPEHVGAEFVRALDTRIVELCTRSWEFWFGLLVGFVEREGHPVVARGGLEKGQQLGNWVNKQRSLHSAGELSAGRAARLAALPGWSWDTRESAWDEGFGHLVAYWRRTGNPRPPAKHIESGYRLGSWVSKQRDRYLGNEMASERADRLERLEGWTWDARQAAWEEGFAALGDFVAREGHSSVPPTFEADGFKLGRWIITQRQRFKRGTLDVPPVERLEELPGWTWNSLDARWDEGFAHLEKFAKREGHCLVPRGHLEGTFRLGDWLTNQVARSYRTGRMRADRRALLEALPGWPSSTVSDARWESSFARLERYVQRHGTSRASQGYVEGDGFRLGGWVASQRQRRKRGTLNPEEARRLEGLEDWTWDATRAVWEDGWPYLQRYVEREGTAIAPRSVVEGGFPLGRWVESARQARRRATLDEAVARRLESLPGWTWHPPRGGAARRPKVGRG